MILKMSSIYNWRRVIFLACASLWLGLNACAPKLTPLTDGRDCYIAALTQEQAEQLQRQGIEARRGDPLKTTACEEELLHGVMDHIRSLRERCKC